MAAEVRLVEVVALVATIGADLGTTFVVALGFTVWLTKLLRPAPEALTTALSVAVRESKYLRNRWGTERPGNLVDLTKLVKVAPLWALRVRPRVRDIFFFGSAAINYFS